MQRIKKINIYEWEILNKGVKHTCSHWANVGHNVQKSVAMLAESSAVHAGQMGQFSIWKQTLWC